MNISDGHSDVDQKLSNKSAAWGKSVWSAEEELSKFPENKSGNTSLRRENQLYLLGNQELSMFKALSILNN